MKKEDLLKMLENKQRYGKRLSAWRRGVYTYAFELIDNLEEEDVPQSNDLKVKLLNGASCWYDYSWGGCSLIYDEDIAKRLCTPSELKKRDNGRLRPNRREDWLDVQARALLHAYCMLFNLINAYEIAHLEDA